MQDYAPIDIAVVYLFFNYTDALSPCQCISDRKKSHVATGPKYEKHKKELTNNLLLFVTEPHVSSNNPVTLQCLVSVDSQHPVVLTASREDQTSAVCGQ